MSSPTERVVHTKFPPITEPVWLEDGRRLHRFRQSSLKDIDLCLERTRLNMSGLLKREEQDAAGTGTVFHEAVELCVLEMIEWGRPLALDDMSHIAHEAFDELIAKPNFRWVKRKEKGARAYLDKCLVCWYDQVLPTLDPVAAEVTWGPLVLHEDAERVIEVTGTIDYADRLFGLGDWKTSGRKWDAWEHERWDIQPTIYTWAAVQTGLIEPTELGRYPFTFWVFVDGRNVQLQTVSVDRHEGDWEWVKAKAVNVARLIESELDPWPMNDNHALCSPTWCPAWDQCKGKYYGEGWPKPSVPRGSAE